MAGMGKSGLSPITLHSYWYQANLEENREAVYVHKRNCNGKCKLRCNGQRGFDIASDMNKFKPVPKAKAMRAVALRRVKKLRDNGIQIGKPFGSKHVLSSDSRQNSTANV